MKLSKKNHINIIDYFPYSRYDFLFSQKNQKKTPSQFLVKRFSRHLKRRTKQKHAKSFTVIY